MQGGYARPRDLEQLLELLRNVAEDHDGVCFQDLLEAVGRRSFGPLLLFTGIIPLSPLSGIPGLSSTIAVCVLLISLQLLLGRHHFWLPRWLLRRRLSRPQLERLLAFCGPVARTTDRFVRPRLQRFVGHPASYGVAVVALLLAVTMPPLEVIPFANSAAGAALTIFGLALIARDGLLVLLGLGVTAGVMITAATVWLI